MNSRTALTLVLIIGIVVLAAFLFATEPPDSGQQQQVIADLAPREIDRIMLKQSGKEDILFNRIGGKWMMTTPYSAGASRFRITAMLQLLREPSSSQLSSTGLDLERFKLANPEVVLIFNEHQFAFGDINGIGKQRYVRHGDIIYLIKDSLYHQLRQAAEFFISTRLLVEGTAVKRFQFPGYELTKALQEWKVEPRIDLDTDAVHKLTNAWLSTYAMRVSAYRPSQPTGAVVIETEQGETIHFNIIEDPSGLILARTDLGIQYHLNSDAAKQLFPNWAPSRANQPLGLTE